MNFPTTYGIWTLYAYEVKLIMIETAFDKNTTF